MLLRPSQKVFAEFLGTAILVATIVGSGAMASNISRDRGIQLAINAAATVLTLGVLIHLLGDISGAHFNPLVTLAERASGRISNYLASLYIGAQFVGAFAGCVLANLMFHLPAIYPSHHARTGNHLLLGEVVATAGLIAIVQLLERQSNGRFASLVIPAWIGSAYFFTSSTAFANPAVTFGRAWSDTFSGIKLNSIWPFMAAQTFGALIGVIVSLLLSGGKSPKANQESAAHT